MATQDLSERMKDYEKCYDFHVPNRANIIIRLDGKNFSRYTRKFNKPFDDNLSMCMDTATIKLCQYLNPKFAYTQSDEISLYFNNIENIESELIFDGKLQKLCSIAASKLTSAFNVTMLKLIYNIKYSTDELLNKITIDDLSEIEAVFDARVFVIPDIREVSNYFIWRQADCTRNSISMAASANFSHKSLEGKSSSEKQDMLMEKGINWNSYNVKYKRGTIIKKMPVTIDGLNNEPVMRNKWLPDYNTPIFTQDKEYLYNLLPKINLL